MSNRKELCKRIDLILRLVPSPPMRYTLDSLLTDLLARGDNKPDQAATIEQLQLDNAKLRATLRRYGKHDSCCGEIVTCVMPCDCGFHKALGETEGNNAEMSQLQADNAKLREAGHWLLSAIDESMTEHNLDRVVEYQQLLSAASQEEALGGNKMNIMKIANTTSPWSLEAFAQAVIEEYKASLVPVAVYKNESITATYGVKWLVQTPLKNDTKLYTLG